jgi:ATP-dependent exoDNAse (exonuclease V) alpha subunit
MGKKTKIRINKEAREVLRILNESDRNVFLTGRAGTGKSTLLSYFRERTKKRHVVLAPTGVAALNVDGQTIHSFFGFHPDIKKSRVRKAQPDDLKLFKKVEMIIIDEISMVRADLLDCVDRALRLNRERLDLPFGGVQMVFIGDLFQLPPIVTGNERETFAKMYPTPYFFSADVMKEVVMEKIELKKVYRQQEQDFVEMLNRIRTRRVTSGDVSSWNIRHDPYFDPSMDDDYIVHLTTTNQMAKQRNDYELRRIDAKEWELEANKAGSIGSRRMPSDMVIQVKEGARIMFTTNDPAKRWVNGSLGTVRRIRCEEDGGFPVIEVELENGDDVEVTRHTWEVFEYRLSDGGKMEEEVVGTYTQYPIMLAWAVTIHKSQGKTFDRVLVDVGRGAFAHGQMYVALSRCTTLEGIVLLREFRARDVILDNAVLDYMERCVVG